MSSLSMLFRRPGKAQRRAYTFAVPTAMRIHTDLIALRYATDSRATGLSGNIARSPFSVSSNDRPSYQRMVTSVAVGTRWGALEQFRHRRAVPRLVRRKKFTGEKKSGWGLRSGNDSRRPGGTFARSAPVSEKEVCAIRAISLKDNPATDHTLRHKVGRCADHLLGSNSKMSIGAGSCVSRWRCKPACHQ